MVCIYCGAPTDVSNSRPQKRLNRVWRRRHCNSCGATFSTTEDVERETSFVVRSGGLDGTNGSGKASKTHLRPFSRDKLLISINESLKHRKTGASDAGALTNTVLGRLPEIMATGGLIEAIHLSALVFDVLNNFDPVAGTHYQAFHSPRLA